MIAKHLCIFVAALLFASHQALASPPAPASIIHNVHLVTMDGPTVMDGLAVVIKDGARRHG